MSKNEVEILGQNIRLDQFLKWASIAYSGGQAKDLIQDGQILVNDLKETHRGRKLSIGDRVKVFGKEYIVKSQGEGLGD